MDGNTCIMHYGALCRHRNDWLALCHDMTAWSDILTCTGVSSELSL